MEDTNSTTFLDGIITTSTMMDNMSAGNNNNTSKKQRLVSSSTSTNQENVGRDDLQNAKENFDKNVENKLRSVEDQLKDAANRLESKILDMELIVCLAENRIALTLDPRYIEEEQNLNSALAEFNELIGKNGVSSMTL